MTYLKKTIVNQVKNIIEEGYGVEGALWFWKSTLESNTIGITDYSASEILEVLDEILEGQAK